MGHPLATHILQRLSQAVAELVNQRFGTAMIAYLDDWLFFQPNLPAQPIIQFVQHLGFTINFRKSIFTPTRRLIYLGLLIDAAIQQIRPTPECLHHMMELLSIIQQASPLDLRRITGYITWLAWAMNWPTFMATHLFQREPYWLLWAFNRGLLHRPRTMGILSRSILIYTDATPWSFGVHVASTPPQQVFQAFTDQIPIAAAEIAAALFALNWVGSRLRQPTNITLVTDSAVTYYTLSTGKGYTIRFNVWLQTLYIAWFKIKLDRGHGLAVRWVPYAANPADPVSRGVLLLVGKTEGKTPLGRPRRRWEGGIRMDLNEIGLGVWIGFDCLRTGTGGGLL
jgi:hypothetical protein